MDSKIGGRPYVLVFYRRTPDHFVKKIYVIIWTWIIASISGIKGLFVIASKDSHKISLDNS